MQTTIDNFRHFVSEVWRMQRMIAADAGRVPDSSGYFALAGCGKREIFERIGPRAPVSATGEHSNHD
jgi:hypothetical protein